MSDGRWYFLARQSTSPLTYKWEAQPEGWDPNLENAHVFPWGMSSFLDEGMSALAEVIEESLPHEANE
jgi:hypothetical protein